MRVRVPLEQSLRLLAPGPVTLASAIHKERFTVTPIGWTSPLSSRPPLVGIVVRPDRFLHELITASGEFGLSIVTKEEADKVFQAGLISGRTHEDKFTFTGLRPVAGRRIAAPLVDQAIGHLECAVLRAIETGDHTLFVGEVLVAEADEAAFDGFWCASDRHPLHYLGGTHFAPLGDRFDAS
ncbi:MAG: flavin reductase family protein [Chloroflexota bacterium]|nr:flavin reductase family protein [Dehalococcoidia bacterium]MDW8253357.1 flavin reductase family protein [Chloroflexota bacterium]